MKLSFRIPLLALMAFSVLKLGAAPNPVALQENKDGTWTLLRNKEPYFIKGAGGSQFHVVGNPYIKWAHEAGANSLKTWGQNQLEEHDEEGKNLLDHANELGMTVCVGLWAAQVRHKFPYDGTLNEKVLKQREALLSVVRKYKDHPAVLIWVLGNEIEIATDPDNPNMWKEINELAALIQKEDPHHPVMTVTAGISVKKAEVIMKYYPNIQILGVNSYKGARTSPDTLKKVGWTKPWVLTEFGAWGPWERPKTSWGAAIEPTSEEKVEMFREAYEKTVGEKHPTCLGSYVFNWGFKQEGTSTWFGMYLTSEERQSTVDLMTYLWTGAWPKNRCPVITGWNVPSHKKTLPPNQEIPISVKAEDPDGDPMTLSWWVMEEAKKPKIGGDREKVPETLPETIIKKADGKVYLRTPAEEGNYRLFVKITDTHRGVSTRNIPFRVEKK